MEEIKLPNFYAGVENEVSCDFLFNVNNLKTRADVLRWYLEMNTGGTPHSKEEIKRVEELYEESFRSTK